MYPDSVPFCKNKGDCMKLLLGVLVAIFIVGCSPSGESADKPVTKAEEERRRSIYWQLEKPEVQLDPIAEEETPNVFYPTKGADEESK